MKIPILACLFLLMFQANAQTITPRYVLARSGGKLPALLYGLGADRLGGAKMGYIDTNIILRVIDSTKDMYSIQLSKYHTAYIEKAYLKFDSIPAEKPFYLTNSFSVKGDTTVDVVAISMEEKTAV
jgi:N-acetylmuramoyl-L-alanine amidase